MATDRLINSTQGDSIIGKLDDIKTAINNQSTAATATPLMDGAAAVGTSTKYARENHVHPTDTSRAANVMSTYAIDTARENITTSSTVQSAIEQLEYREETNKNNILTDEAALVELVNSGAKNIADFTSTTKTTFTTAHYNGVTITRNGDIFTISGTSDTDDNIFFNIYFDGSPSTKMIPPGNWVALIEDYTGTVVNDIAVQPCAPAAYTKVYGIPVKFSLSGSESGNWVRINLRPSTAYDGSFRLMICSQEDYAISPKFVPYRPSYQELYERVIALEQANQ